MKKKGEKFEKVTLSDKKPVKWRKKEMYDVSSSLCCLILSAVN